MRVEVTPTRVELSPGFAHSVSVTIANTETIIAGFSIRVLGADPGWVELPADGLSLFPDESRSFDLTVTPPAGLPAGTRRVAVQVRELTPPFATTITDIDLMVPAAPRSTLRVDPLAVTAGKRATFSLLVENTGNTDLRGRLAGDDPAAQVRFTFDPERIVIAPGQHSVIDLQAAAKRRLFGTPTVRSLSIYLDPLPEDVFFRPDPSPSASTDERPALATATFIQKAIVARGALALVGLLVAASVFAVVITVALSRLVAQSTADRNLALQVAAAHNSASTSGSSGLAGTALLLTSGKGLAGVAVSVFTSSDTTTPVDTTATTTTGAYSFGHLAAGQYVLSFRGAGFVQVWYPGAVAASDATTITVATGQVKTGLNVSLGGVPASLSGLVVGDDVSAATLFLTTVPSAAAAADAAAHPSSATATTPGQIIPPNNGGAVVQHVPIGSDGSFALSGVPSPSVYELVVTKAGYATSSERIDVRAGETRTGVQVTLVKGDGLINGSITALSGPLAGATIVATTGPTTSNTISLTGSHAGSFTLRSLPTPSSVTVVVSKAGYTSQTVSLNLGTAQKLTGVVITLSRSSASLPGMVTLAAGGKPAGGVDVTVTNGQLTVHTVTESTGDVGAWQAAGLSVPGTYTVTFSRSDLQSQTVSVSLDANGAITPGSYGTRVTASGLVVSMQSSSATVAGVITQTDGRNVCDKSTNALGEAAVSLSSGASTYSVTSASVAPNCGRYQLDAIPPGTYTLTVSATSGTTPTSKVITVSAGQSLSENVALIAPASISGVVECCNQGSKAPIGPRAHWTVFLYQQAQYPSVVTATVTTAADGTFTFSDVDAGRYILAAGPTSDAADATTTTLVTVLPSQRRTGVAIVVSQ